MIRYVQVVLLIAIIGCQRQVANHATLERNDFESPFEGLDKQQLSVFERGDENFQQVFNPKLGLGPIFNNSSCNGCHPNDGRGKPEFGFFRISKGTNKTEHPSGPQIQDKAILGMAKEQLPTGVNHSFRMPPPVFGMGLVEAIPVDHIVANADPLDQDGDGVSGRPNWVTPPRYVSDHVGGDDEPELGRFGWKAESSSLLQIVAQALQQDMGITTDFLPVDLSSIDANGETRFDEVPDPELPALIVLQTVEYLRLIAPPAPGQQSPAVERGRVQFGNLRCDACHVPKLRTGQSEIAAVNEVDVWLYSDLLLHDMGEELADVQAEPSAFGREWRTPPLWGTRLIGKFLSGEKYFLHDGRARTLEEAILAHGGEARLSSDLFRTLNKNDQDDLIAFLESL